MGKTGAKKQLAQLCKEFGVEDVYELAELHLNDDQERMRAALYDIYDRSLLNNKIKDALLEIDLSKLPEDERNIVKNILWLWYHHATTIILWQKHDIPLAREYCDIALTYLYPEHPNKITPMLCLLLQGRIDEARTWADTKVGEIEREYADHLLAEYEKGIFKEKPPTQSIEGHG